jgi:hypothetical protein
MKLDARSTLAVCAQVIALTACAMPSEAGWTQVPEPEGVVFHGVLPSNRRIWLAGTVRPTHPIHFEWELGQLDRRSNKTLVCVDLEPKYGGLYFEGKKGEWWWQSSHFREMYWDDPAFSLAVQVAVCEPMPDAVEGPYTPKTDERPFLGITARMTGPDTWEVVSPARQTYHSKRMEARKGWGRRR